MTKQIHVRIMRTEGFTLVELLVVIAVIAILISLLLPGIQSVRESARRTQCATNLHQMSAAVHNYESAHGSLPPGVVDKSGPIVSLPQGHDQGWLGTLLPYLEQQIVYRHIDRDKSVYDSVNKGARSLTISTYVCPSSSVGKVDVGYSNYAGVHHDVEAPIDTDNHGLFFLNSNVTQHDISDGLGYTLMIGEKRIDHPLPDLGWLSGTAATLRNTGTPINMTGKNPPGAVTPLAIQDDFVELDPPSPSAKQSPTPETSGENNEIKEAQQNNGDPQNIGDTGRPVAGTAPVDDQTTPRNPSPQALFVGGFGSDHPTGANFAFADGQIRFLMESLDTRILQQLGHRADGQLLDISEVD